MESLNLFANSTMGDWQLTEHRAPNASDLALDELVLDEVDDKDEANSNGTKEVKAGEAINLFPMQLVLLILSPDYLTVLAYLTLVWQL